MEKNITVGVLATLAIVFGVLFFKSPTVIEKTAEQQQTINENLGAIPGSDLQSSYLNVNGVYTYYKNKGLVSGTTTPCAIQSPSASSTLIEWSIQTTNASSTASLLTFAKAKSFNATTTAFGTGSIVANNKAFFSSTTPSISGTLNENSKSVFSPNQWFVIGQEGGTAGQPFLVTGTCQAIFRGI